jgi:5-methylcytosine-specific restriction endonuclease McrA
MGKMTPSAAKNAIRRALRGIVDPYPSATQIHRIWAFFDSSCAYCGRSLVRGDRDAHIDHLVAPGAGGSNALANFILSCGLCNGDEKRDEHWESFLRRKAPDDAAYNLRRSRIESWVGNCNGATLDASVALGVDREIERAIVAFDVALKTFAPLSSAGYNDYCP